VAPAQPYPFQPPPGAATFQPSAGPTGFQPAPNGSAGFQPAPAGTAGFQPAPAVPSPPAPPPVNAWSILAQARGLIEENKIQAALPLIKEFIKLRPLEPEGYFWQGVALDNLQQTEAALAAYSQGCTQVMKAGMDSAELRMNAGNDLLKLRRVDLAIQQYQRAAQIDPGLPLVQLNLGRALIEKGDIEGALQCFQRCEDLHFKPYQLSYYRAKALKKVGRVDDARAQVQMALSKLNDGSDASKRLRQEFSDLLGAQ
jgi:tetratricopeptide (TPR) repeat protein